MSETSHQIKMDIELTENLTNLKNLSDWEKAAILQVLKRNKAIKQREERRVAQLAVRIQLQRMDEYMSIHDDCELKTKTGQWHEDLVYKRCKQSPTELHSTLYRQLSSDLISSGSQKSSPEPSTSSKQSINSKGSDKCFYSNNKGLDMKSVKEWIDKHSQYSHGSEEENENSNIANENNNLHNDYPKERVINHNNS
ncbi:uncharacterized protein LOC143444341 [Clavelina lepadiformis]|uniref:uncharacterized protein LOC143444341 n=1 Tax=Clavelina lepadiformis TaxID=159417 RepID=UPI0040416DD9